MRVLIAIILLLVSTGCNSYTFKSSRLAKAEGQLAEVQRQVTEKQKQYATATVDALTYTVAECKLCIICWALLMQRSLFLS